jgi:LDH2 family malate/lactate/ureidoglycolate dehydrogenase
MAEQIVSYEQLKDLCEKKLIDAGIPADDAAVTGNSRQ